MFFSLYFHNIPFILHYTMKITVRRSSEENMWERLRRRDSPSSHRGVIRILSSRVDRFFSRDLPTFSRIPHTRAYHSLPGVDPRPRRHARTGQGQARFRPTYRTDQRPALNFIHTPRGRLSVLTRNTKRRSHGSDNTSTLAAKMREAVKFFKYPLISNIASFSQNVTFMLCN